MVINIWVLEVRRSSLTLVSLHSTLALPLSTDSVPSPTSVISATSHICIYGQFITL